MLPAQRQLRLCCLRYLAGQFECGRLYTVSEADELLLCWHPSGNPATLRAELLAHGFLRSASDGHLFRFLPAEVPSARVHHSLRVF